MVTVSSWVSPNSFNDFTELCKCRTRFQFQNIRLQSQLCMAWCLPWLRAITWAYREVVISSSGKSQFSSWTHSSEHNTHHATLFLYWLAQPSLIPLPSHKCSWPHWPSLPHAHQWNYHGLSIVYPWNCHEILFDFQHGFNPWNFKFSWTS